MEPLSDIKQHNSIPVFFIVARPRTGSSLLRLLFDAHPNIQIPIEAPVFLDMVAKYGKIKDWNIQILDSFYKDLFKLRRFKEWDINEEKLKSDLHSCEGTNTYQNICKVVHLNYISAFEKKEIKYIGDKNPHYSLQFDDLLKLFPDSRFIHLTRDYRDHYLSMKRADFYESRLSLIIYNWKKSEKRLNEIKSKNGHSILTLRYEDLVTNPKKEMTSLMEFLNLDFNPEVLEYYNQKEYLKKIYSEEYLTKHFGSLLKPITSEKIDEWKNQMSDVEVEIADYIAGKYAEESGYERKFLKRKLSLWFYLQPRIFIVHSYNIYLNLIRILPGPISKRLRKALPGPIKFYARIFST